MNEGGRVSRAKMRLAGTRRTGVASVVGTMLFVVVLLVALAAQAKIFSVQAQASQAAQQAQEVQGRHAMESLAYSGRSSGLTVTDDGPSSALLVAMVLKFENGTVYTLSAKSTPAFVPAPVASNGALSVQPLVPLGVCTPGTATCLSKYLSIVGGSAVSGRALGLLTSSGNTFWYAPQAQAGQAATYYRTATTVSTSSSSWVGIPGLAFTGEANSFYVVQVLVAFWQSSPSPAVIAFAVSVPSGATFLFCGGLYWADPAQATTDLGPGNLCTGSANTTLGPTHNTQTSCIASGTACEFVGTAFVSFGAAGGPFQLEFEGSSTDTANVLADSVIIVTRAG